MAPFIFIVVGMVTLVFTLFPIKATVWLEERLLVTLYMFPVFLSVIFVPTETDGVGVTVGAEVIAGVGVAVGTGVTVGIGSLAIVSVLVTPQIVQARFSATRALAEICYMAGALYRDPVWNGLVLYPNRG